MRINFLVFYSFIIVSSYAIAESEYVYKSGFEYGLKLNDTGITWAGEYSSGNNLSCTVSGTNTSLQDCNDGRDVQINDDTDGHAGFSFTKLDSNGNPLPASAISWSCVKDNVTGLIWEVKSPVFSSIHYEDIKYKWGGLTAIGLGAGGLGTYYSDWNVLVEGSNNESFCGLNDWRVPTVSELLSIVNNNGNNPSIDTNYFPYTVSHPYWTASPVPSPTNAGFAFAVNFINGSDIIPDRSVTYRVRLVNSSQ